MNYSIQNLKRDFLLMLCLSFCAILTSKTVAQDLEFPFPGETWDRWEEPEDAGYDSEALESVLGFIIDSMNTTGLVIVVEGKILGDYGDIAELSYLASCRKSILAMLYGKYVEDGTIDLNKTLKELNIEDLGGLLEIEERATVLNLITARSGVYHEASNGGDNYADAPARGSQQPGSYFLYNNWDFNVAGTIFELSTGQLIYEALQKDLADPIQMEDFDITKQRKYGNSQVSQFPAYHMWLSTRDMARLGYLMLRKGDWNGQQLIPQSWVEKIVSPYTPIEEMNPGYMREGYFGYGYMWWVWQGEKNQGPYNGAYTARGAYGQYITVLPALDMVIAHKTKAEYGRRTTWLQYEKLLDMIVEAR